MEAVIAILAIFSLPILMVVMVAVFERRDGRHRFAVVGGRLRRTSKIERETTQMIDQMRRTKRIAYESWVAEGWRELVGRRG